MCFYNDTVNSVSFAQLFASLSANDKVIKCCTWRYQANFLVN